MEPLPHYLYKKFKENIATWEDNDIYAISFFVYDVDDDPYKPSVTLGYNTISNFQNSIEAADDYEEEAKWNYAYWLQNEEYYFGYDSDGEIIDNWLDTNDYRNLSEADEPEYDSKYRYIGKGPAITQKFVAELVKVAKQLHANGDIREKIGIDVPIIIHELEYYDAIANQTKEANPEGLADEFAGWVYNM